jgi:hypothetical protein
MYRLPKAALLELRRCRKSLPICLKLSCFLLFSTSGIKRFQLFGADLLSRRAQCDAAAALATDRRAFPVDLLLTRQSEILGSIYGCDEVADGTAIHRRYRAIVQIDAQPIE